MPKKKTEKVEKTAEVVETPKTSEKKTNTGKILLVIAIFIILFFIAYRNRSLIIVATVNGKPVWRPVLEQKMVNQVGQKALDEIINEQILTDEMAKRNIIVTDKDIEAKIAEIQKTLPSGTKLQDALTAQGMNFGDFRNQIKLQLGVEKMLSDVKISDKDIKDFIEQNKQYLTATDEASIREQAIKSLQGTKRNEEFQKIFENLKKQAKISRFL